jgi:hypothetical protein
LRPLVGGRNTPVPSLSFDLEDPPEDPPVDCTDPLTWHLAYSLHHAHRPDAEGNCACGSTYPCPSAHLATRGFRFACGATEPAEDAVAA